MNQKEYRKVKKIFQSAIELVPEKRADFLDQECGHDKTLRRGVERLLKAEESGFLEEPAIAQVAEEIADDENRSELTDTIQGNQNLEQFGNYKLTSRIGKGGMGEVFLARDSSLDRQVAIKFLNQEFDQDSDKLNRFIQEAKAASALNHPNILTIHEIGQIDGKKYIASEFVKGKTLRVVLGKKGSLSLGTVLRIGVQIAEALMAAHGAGIIHRDIKPDNIMIREDGYAKVLDFGLAKLSERSGVVSRSDVDPEDPTHIRVKTDTGLVMGTASYMSPEQARGKAVDARSDIFSFGVLMYEMLTGEMPFQGESLPEVFVAILEKEPVPVSDHMPETSAELQYIIGKALRKDKDERYQSMKSLLADLKTLKADLEFQNKLERSVQPEEPKTRSKKAYAKAERRPKATSENPTLAATSVSRFTKLTITGLAVLILTAIGFWYWYSISYSGQIKSIAVMPFINESGNKDVDYLSDGMATTLITSLTQIPDLSVKAKSTVFYYKDKGMSPKEIGEELDVESVLMGTVIQRGDDIRLSLELVDTRTLNAVWSGTYDRKMSDLVALQSEITKAVSDNLRLKLTGGEKKKLTKTYINDSEAYRAYLKGFYHMQKLEVEDHLKAIGFFKQAVKLEPDSGFAWGGLAHAYVWAPKDRVPDHITKARSAVKKAIALAPELPLAHMVLGNISYIEDWDLVEAEKEYQTAIRLDPKEGDLVHLGYAWILASTGRLDDAVEEMKTGLKIEPLALLNNRDLGEFLFVSGKYEEASKHYQRALESFPDDWFLHQLYAVSLAYQGNFKEAIAECNKSIELNRNPIPTRLCLGEIYAKSGDRNEAYKILDEDIKAKPDAEVAWRVEPDSSLLWRAEIYALLNDKAKTLKVLETLAGIMKEKNVRGRWYEDFQIRYSPNFDNLRDDPRFKDLVGRIGYPESARKR